MKKLIKTIIFTTLVSLPIAACGVKPNSVDAPQSTNAENEVEIQEDLFPKIYPTK